MARIKATKKPVQPEHRTIIVTPDTDLTQFKPGQRVELTFVPLSEYKFDENGDPDPVFSSADVAILIKDYPMTGTILNVDTETYDEPWIDVKMDANGREHSWIAGNLITIRVIGEVPIHEMSSKIFIRDDEENEREFNFEPGVGISAIRPFDNVELDSELIKWLAGAFGVGPSVPDPKFETNGYSFNLTFDTYLNSFELHFGCQKYHRDQVLKFLNWAMPLICSTEEKK